MTELQEIIAKIQADKNCDKWYEIAKVAYERGELINLFSADEKYTVGNEWLKPDSQLSMGMDEGPINERALFSGIVNLYRKTKDVKVKQAFIEVFAKMTVGTDKQIYFAIKLFYSLAKNSLLYKYYPFKDVYEELTPFLIGFVNKNTEKLKSIKVYICKDNDGGLYKLCEYYSNKIVEIGGKPIVAG